MLFKIMNYYGGRNTLRPYNKGRHMVCPYKDRYSGHGTPCPYNITNSPTHYYTNTVPSR